MLRRRRGAGKSHGPVFPDSRGGWRDASNTSRDLRNARGSEEFAWVTSHVFRKTAATELDRAGLSARQIADQLGGLQGVDDLRSFLRPTVLIWGLLLRLDSNQ